MGKIFWLSGDTLAAEAVNVKTAFRGKDKAKQAMPNSTKVMTVMLAIVAKITRT